MTKNNPATKNLISILVICLIILGVIYIRLKILPAKKESTGVSVRLKWLHQAQFAGMYTAAEKHLYEQTGLKVDLKERDVNAGSITKEVLSGKVDFGIVSPLDFLANQGGKNGVKAVAVIYQYSPAVVASLKTKNITSPEQWKNKSFGISGSGPDAKLFFQYFINKNKISTNSVSYKTAGLDQLSALLNGQIDIGSFYRTQVGYSLEKNNIHLNFYYPEQNGLKMYDDVIITSNKMIREHPDIVKKFVSATLEGWSYALMHQDEGVDFTMKYATAANHDTAMQKYILKNSRPLIEPGSNGKIGDMEYDRWQSIYSTLAQSIAMPEINIADVYTLDFLNKESNATK